MLSITMRQAADGGRAKWLGAGMMVTFTDWDIIRNLLLAGRWTVLLSLVAFIGGALVTLPPLLLPSHRRTPVKRLIRGYIELFQGTPLLMQLFLAFGVALFGIDVSPWTAVSLALTFYTSAFYSISGSAAFARCRKGREASRCLGLSFAQTLFRVISRRRRVSPLRPPWVCGAGGERHRAGVDYRLRRTDQSWHDADQRDLSAV